MMLTIKLFTITGWIGLLESKKRQSAPIEVPNNIHKKWLIKHFFKFLLQFYINLNF